MTRNIEKRLGLIIGLHRNKKVKQGHSEFKQIQFIKSDLKHPYEGVSLNENVCSLATLSRIENGKHQHDYMLIEYFLRKLDIQYRIKESIYQKERLHLRNISLAFGYAPIHKLHELMISCEQFYVENHDDVLLAFDHQVFRFIDRFFRLKRADRKEFDHLLKIFDAIDPCLQDWILGSGLWLKQTHPDFWDLEICQKYIDRTKHVIESHISSDIKDNILDFKFNHFFNIFHNDSWFINELQAFSSQNDLDLIEPHYHSEMTFCLQIANQNKHTKNGHSKLYHALHTYTQLCPISKIKYLSDTLIDLLIHEPYPKSITRIISQNALTLCQTQKSYKPLIKLIELHLENDLKNLTLSSIFHHYVKENKPTTF